MLKLWQKHELTVEAPDLQPQTMLYRGYPTHLAENGRMLAWEELSPIQLASAACGSPRKAAVILPLLYEQLEAAELAQDKPRQRSLEYSRWILEQLMASTHEEL